jgi:hypothetical protein
LESILQIYLNQLFKIMFISKLAKSTTSGLPTQSRSVSRRFVSSQMLPKIAPNNRVVVEETKEGKFTNKVTANSHILVADEPGTIEGGKDSGMSPYDLLLSSLGTCTSSNFLKNDHL